MKKFLAVLLLIVIIISVSACGGQEKSGTDLVKVGDTIISENELDQYMEFEAFTQGYDLSQISEEELKMVKAQMLDYMVSMECIRQYYAGKEDEVLPDTVETDLKSFLDESKSNEYISNFLKEKKISDETLTKMFHDQYYMSSYFEEVEAGMENLDQDSRAYYDANIDSFKVDEVTASHILVNEEKTAQEILTKLEAGEKFEDLAGEYGTDGTKDTGGSLGTFGRGRMVKEFEDAVFALQPGEISDIVETEFGYHIIMVTDKNQGTKTYEESRESIVSNLVSQEVKKKIYDLKDSTEIEYLTDEYKPITGA